MGGSYTSNDPTSEGASCSFSYYAVDQSFQLYDAGFRCCFDSDPTM